MDRSVDFLHGPLLGSIVRFTCPIAVSGMLQQLFHAADTAVAGRFADSGALAAVGANVEIVALLVTLSAGLASGANVLLAKLAGQGRGDQLSGALHTAVLLSLVLGIGGGLLGVFAAGPVLSAIQTPEELLGRASGYLQIYLAGYPCLLLYDFGSAILRAGGDSRRPFWALAASGVVNVVLNLFFVIVLRLGVYGVAIATDLATGLSAGMVLYWLWKETGAYHLSVKALCLRWKYVRQLLAVGIPAAIQGAVFCLANVFVQAAVNSFGNAAIAGSTIGMNLEYFAYYIVTAFGQTAATFTSQNAAAGNWKRCVDTLKLCLLLSALGSALFTVPLTVWCHVAAGCFTTDPAAAAAACQRIRIILALEPLCSMYEVPAGVMRGSGHAALSAALTVLGTCVFRVTWIFTVFQSFRSLDVLFLAFPLSWIVTALLVWLGWLRVRPLTHREQLEKDLL